MRILAVQHDDDTHLGSLAVPIAESADIETWLPDRQPAPARPIAEYDGVVVLGGVAMPDEDDRHPWIPRELEAIGEAVERGIPLLGICLGSQLLARAMGGVVRPSDASEVGWYRIALRPEAADDPVIGGLPDGFEVYHWHHYAWEPPADATLLATTPAANQAFRVGDAAWGLQFHIEVTEEIVSDWTTSDLGVADLAEHGFDGAPILQRTDEVIDGYIERAHDLARRFMAVVAARSTHGLHVS